MDIEVHYTLHLPEEHVKRVLEYAIERGMEYGEDPGKKEVIRRLVMDSGFNELLELLSEPLLPITRHK